MSQADSPIHDILILCVHRDYFGSVPEDIAIGVNLLAVFLRQKGCSALLFRGFGHEAEEWLEETMSENGARSIGFYCDYENVSLVAELSRRAKEKWGIPVFVGGPQAVGLDGKFLRDSRCDAIVRGEGELTLLELLENYCRNGKSLSEIEGITYLDETGNMVICPDRKQIENLDDLPWPDFRLEKGHELWHILPVMSGRGCPFRCAFCYEGHNTRKVRLRSVPGVIEEIRCHFDRHPNCKYIFFVDDTFTLNPRRVEQFCTELTKLRRERDFVWFCEGHVQTLFKWPQMLRQMAEAGLAKLFIGIESGSDEVLGLYRKQTTVDMIESVVHRSVEAGIPQITGNIIVGGPVERSETIAADIGLVTRLLHAAPGRFDALGFFLMPYPNTAIRRHPMDFGIRLLPAREAHGLEDIPLTETDALSWADMFNARHSLNSRIQKTMTEIYLDGKVPHETIVSSYRLAFRYGVYSRWLINVFTHHTIYNNYYRLLGRDAASHSRDVPEDKLYRWHPQRVFEIWNSVSLEKGYLQVGKHVLSPLEYDLLLLCSGKFRLSEVLDSAWDSYRNRFDSRQSFNAMALELLSGFEKRRWLVYAPF